MSDTANSINLDVGRNVLECSSNKCDTLIWEYSVPNQYIYTVSSGEIVEADLTTYTGINYNFDLYDYNLYTNSYPIEVDLNYIYISPIYNIGTGECASTILYVEKKLYHNINFCEDNINDDPSTLLDSNFEFLDPCTHYNTMATGEITEFDFVFTDKEVIHTTRVYDGSINLNLCTPSSDFNLSDCGFNKIIPISGKSLEYNFTICSYPNPPLLDIPHDFVFNSTYNWACDLLGAEYGTGEGITVELQPDTYMPFDTSYTGEYAKFDVLSASINFYNMIGKSGELALADLTENPFDQIDSDVHTGEHIDLFLTIYQHTFESDNYSSEYADADLTDNPADQIDSDAMSGEIALTDIYNTITFSSDNYSGEVADADLTDNPSAEIDSDAMSGEIGILNELYTYDVFDPYNYQGESIIVELFDNPAEELEALAYSSEVGIVNAISIQSVLNSTNYRGEFGTVDSIWTSYTLDGDVHTGEHGSADLTINLPEELSGIGYSGEYADGDSDGILDYILMEFNDILTGQTAYDGLGVAGGINFCNITCCTLPKGDLVVFDYTENTLEVWDECGPVTEIVASAELSVAVRFHIDQHHGEYGLGTIGLEYTELEFDPIFTGENITAIREALETIRFCPGYLIPDGDNTIFDFASNINIGCYGWFTYASEMMDEPFLKTWQSLFPNVYTGELARCSIHTDHYYPPVPMLFKAWTGEIAKLYFPELFPAPVGQGEYSAVALERRKYLGYSGEKATCILERWYPTVEWITPADQCIPNEYYPMKAPDFRDPDYSYENYLICVEEMEYKGQVEAHCIHFDDESLANYPFIVPDVMWCSQKMNVSLKPEKRIQVNDVLSGESVHTFELESESI